MENKLAIMKITPHMFIEMCKNGSNAVKIVKNALPKDSEYVRAFTEDYSGWGYISIVIKSDSFEELKEGSEIPVLPYTVFEKVG